MMLQKELDDVSGLMSAAWHTCKYSPTVEYCDLCTKQRYVCVSYSIPYS